MGIVSRAVPLTFFSMPRSNWRAVSASQSEEKDGQKLAALHICVVPETGPTVPDARAGQPKELLFDLRAFSPFDAPPDGYITMRCGHPSLAVFMFLRGGSQSLTPTAEAQ